MRAPIRGARIMLIDTYQSSYLFYDVSNQFELTSKKVRGILPSAFNFNEELPSVTHR